MLSEPANNLWSKLREHKASNEAMVETWFVLPLLEALGHELANIAPKVPVLFREGRNSRQGRKPEADFVVYAEKPFCRATSLMVVESKHPNEELDDGKSQGESYAHELRAPILLLTNGRKLEVWQLQQTIESECVFSGQVADLERHRGTLESLLSPEALRSRCELLAHKRFDLMSRDFSGYERAAHERAERDYLQSIERILLDRDTNRAINSGELFNLVGKGAVVAAASGYGKTAMARKLLYDAIEQRWAGKTEALPIDVFVPDLAQSGKSLEDFLTSRVNAHKPGFTNSALQDIARGEGVVVIVDGFERIEHAGRSRIETELRIFLTDYPNARVFLMSRSQVAPTTLGLRVFVLQQYGPSQLHDLAELRARTFYGVGNMFSGAPNHVLRLCEIPLIADLVVDHYATSRSYPVDLSVLFEQWLEQILAASHLVDRAFDLQLLGDIAVATVDGPITILRACELVVNHVDPKGTLLRLAEQDAISLRGTTVELQHEALADHLRVIKFWSGVSTFDEVQLDTLSFDPSSHFAILLVSNAPTQEKRAAAWKAIARQNIQLAIRSLRFTGFDKVTYEVAADEDARRLASDIQSTLETLIDSHFKSLAPLLLSRVAGKTVERLGVTAMVDAYGVYYQFFSAKADQVPISVVDLKGCKTGQRSHFHALNKVGRGPGAGRVFAVGLLKQELIKVIDDRGLIGGRVWTEERTFGRLRHLANYYNFPIDPMRFDLALVFLKRYAGQVVDSGGQKRRQTFDIDELLNDLQNLRNLGVLEFERWWGDLGQVNLQDSGDQQRLAMTLNAYHRRSQLAYNEVVTHSLPALRPHLRTLRLMPLRMEIVAHQHQRQGYHDISLGNRRWPVRGYEEAGADVTFSDVVPEDFNEEEIQSYIDKTDRLLRQFGRYLDDRVVSWGWGRMPDLEGNGFNYGAQADESAITFRAMDLLKGDLQHLFSEAPSGIGDLMPKIE